MAEKITLFQDFIRTSIGFWVISASEQALTSLSYKEKQPPSKTNPSPITDLAKQQLNDYFDKKLTTFNLPLDTSGYSDFYKQVWKALAEVPYGKLSTYSKLAIAINNPMSVRAVGLANGKNPFPIILPCHRIIGKDNSLTGYASGLKVKRWLLEHEGAIAVQKSLF